MHLLLFKNTVNTFFQICITNLAKNNLVYFSFMQLVKVKCILWELLSINASKLLLI